ncbi:MAG TPA: OmpA family protein [Bryobacteraceae bacterium]|nr:OmpA family protein [Bryobacteraceae bacterium]
MTRQKTSALLLTVSSILFAAGCGNCVTKLTSPAPPPAPEVATPAPTPTPTPTPAPKPAIQFSAEPGTIQQGQCATLRWSVSDATEISIAPGIGAVNARGERQVCPGDATTYTLTAGGPGGSDTATGTVNVTVPPPPPPPAPTPTPVPKKTLSELLATEVQDVYFGLNKSKIREDASAVLTHDAEALKQIFAEIPDGVVQIEGNCDERASAEYNIGLGARRAAAAKDFLVQLGVPADRLKTVSYGKERPVCTEANEECWQKNRHDHFAVAQ